MSGPVNCDMYDSRRVRRNLIAVLVVLGVWTVLVQVAAAQSQRVESQQVPLGDAFLVLGIIAEHDVLVLGVPSTTVQLPQQVDDWRGLMDVLTRAHGLEWCLVGWNIVVGPEGRVCEEGTPGRRLADEVAGDHASTVAEVTTVTAEGNPSDVAAAARPEALGLRLRVVQIDERLATELGISWRSGVFNTAAQLVLGGGLIAGGVFPPHSFDEIVSFLETEGVAVRLEDLTLAAVVGYPVVFNRGGTINVTLARETSVERSYTYGLGLTVTANRSDDAVVLEYVFNDSAPSVQSVELIDIAATSSRGAVVALCGETVVLANSASVRDEGEGGGLPGAARLPGVGWLGGSGSDRVTTGSFVVTLEPVCA